VKTSQRTLRATLVLPSHPHLGLPNDCLSVAEGNGLGLSGLIWTIDR